MTKFLTSTVSPRARAPRKASRSPRTTSTFAPHFFARLVDVYGLERVQAGIPIRVCERVSRREKRRYHDFRVATEAL